MMLHAGTGAIPPLGTAVPLAVAAVLYVRGAGRVQQRPRAWLFLAAWTAFGIALASPLHELGRASLTLHMVQHVLLMSVAAPLLVWSRPSAVLLRGLGLEARERLIPVLRWLQPAAAALTGLTTAAVLQGVALWVWHVPALYSRGVVQPLVHDAQHLSLLGSALLYWASIAAALRHRERTGGALLSLFLTTLHTGLLGALLTFSRVAWYEAYRGPGAVADQQLAGLVMWVPGALPNLAAAVTLIWRALEQPRSPLSSSLGVETP